MEHVIYIAVLMTSTAAALIWFSQIVDVVLRSEADFESHTHKLLWFLVILLSNIVGALWYLKWKKARVSQWKSRAPK